MHVDVQLLPICKLMLNVVTCVVISYRICKSLCGSFVETVTSRYTKFVNSPPQCQKIRLNKDCNQSTNLQITTYKNDLQWFTIWYSLYYTAKSKYLIPKNLNTLWGIKTPKFIDRNLKADYQIFENFSYECSRQNWHQMIFRFPTSSNVCFCTTWGNRTSNILHFYLIQYDYLIQLIHI